MFGKLLASLSLGWLVMGCASSHSKLHNAESHAQSEVKTSSEALAAKACDTPPAPCCLEEKAPACRACQEETKAWEAMCGEKAQSDAHASTVDCFAPQDFAAMSQDEANAWRQACQPSFDCERPFPGRVCCMAMIESCLRCAAEGQHGPANHAFACFGDTKPLPAEYNCAETMPLRPVCKALTQQCFDAANRNKAIRNGFADFCQTQPQ